jgi:SH3-like domain-containing protein
MNQLKRFALTALTGVLAFSLAEAQTRVVIKADRTNVRAKPSLDAEILVSLSKGQEVEVLGEWTSPGSKETWSRIVMPSAVPVWVYAPLVDAKAGTVRAKELNYRAGPGRNYSVLGLLKKGAPIQVIREFDGWVQIKPPAQAVAFVASRLLTSETDATPMAAARTRTPPPTPAPAITSQPTPTPTPAPLRRAPVPTRPAETAPPTSSFDATPIPALAQPDNRPTPPRSRTEDPIVATPVPEPSPVVPAATPEATEATPVATTEPAASPVSTTVPPTRKLPLGSPRYRSTLPPTPSQNVVISSALGRTQTVIDELDKPRFVVREGIVHPTVSIQAPTDYELRDGFYAEGNINYLMPQPNSTLEAFSGKRVSVSGFEYRDVRWRTPVLKVEDIELLP